MKVAIRIDVKTTGVYRASCPALPGCVAFGRSHEEARQKIDQAVRGYLASLDVPVPMRLEHDVCTA